MAECYIEPYDVNEYRIYDRDCYLYHANVEGRRVVISKNEHALPDQESLKMRLIDGLKAFGEPVTELQGMSLESLLERAARHFP